MYILQQIQPGSNSQLLPKQIKKFHTKTEFLLKYNYSYIVQNKNKTLY